MKNFVNLNETSRSSYRIVDDDKFVINSKTKLSIKEEDVDRVIGYSSLNNNIVEIYELTEDKCVSKFYPDLMPMVIIAANNFYEKSVFLERSESYQKFIKNFDNVNNLYNRIVDSYIDFITNTGCYFEDMSANNVMVNSDYSEFKIIDVFSIKKFDRLVEFNPLSIMMCKKLEEGIDVPLRLDGTLNEFLEGIDVKSFKEDTLNKIFTRKFVGNWKQHEE
jgi:hypothetical protein